MLHDVLNGKANAQSAITNTTSRHHIAYFENPQSKRKSAGDTGPCQKLDDLE